MKLAANKTKYSCKYIAGSEVEKCTVLEGTTSIEAFQGYIQTIGTVFEFQVMPGNQFGIDPHPRPDGTAQSLNSQLSTGSQAFEHHRYSGGCGEHRRCVSGGGFEVSTEDDGYGVVYSFQFFSDAGTEEDRKETWQLVHGRGRRPSVGEMHRGLLKAPDNKHHPSKIPCRAPPEARAF